MCRHGMFDCYRHLPKQEQPSKMRRVAGNAYISSGKALIQNGNHGDSCFLFRSGMLWLRRGMSRGARER